MPPFCRKEAQDRTRAARAAFQHTAVRLNERVLRWRQQLRAVAPARRLHAAAPWNHRTSAQRHQEQSEQRARATACGYTRLCCKASAACPYANALDGSSNARRRHARSERCERMAALAHSLTFKLKYSHVDDPNPDLNAQFSLEILTLLISILKEPLRTSSWHASCCARSKRRCDDAQHAAISVTAAALRRGSS
ncbi:hypothetical protein JKP88DRAFT_251890 [Tribonema minus]|uniref:Uncharacterized protein n=2 Tax=Tribonema minus TaxID=303371 RepID=A0A835ZEY1_9STRA|nr:hypothetical protein JKP88DRAFT_251890 [Tribonema minus]